MCNTPTPRAGDNPSAAFVMITPPEPPPEEEEEEGEAGVPNMLPPLDRLSVGARTGVNPAVKRRHAQVEETRDRVLGEADLVTAVLEAIKVEDWETACATAKAWCAANQLFQDACSKADGSWRVLNERYFKGSPFNVRVSWVNPIVDFYENCRRAKEYKEGKYSQIQDEDKACGTFVLELFKLGDFGHEWGHLDAALKDDEAFALKAVSASGDVLKYMRSRYKRNRAIVLAAVTSAGGALQYANPSFVSDAEIALVAVTGDGAALRYVDEAFRDRPEYVLPAVKECPFALQWASGRMKRNREVVLAAVRKHGAQLMYADARLKNDRRVVLAAVDNWPRAIEYASLELRADREVAMAAVRRDGNLLVRVASDLRDDRDLVIAAVRKHPRALMWASSRLRDDFYVVMQAVTAIPYTSGSNDLGETSGGALGHASERLRANLDIVRAAVRADPQALNGALEPALSIVREEAQREAAERRAQASA